jgi:hypothetical protein
VARRLLLVFVLCVLAVAYLYQYSYSMKLTRNLSRLETEARLLAERLDEVNADIVRLSGFARMESLWTEHGRPVALVALLDRAEGQSMALVRHLGVDEAAR